MGIEHDIQRLLANVLKEFNGNSAAAAASLGVNPVTFWGWMQGTRRPARVLYEAIDKAGGVLLIPGEPRPDESGEALPFSAEMKIEAYEKIIAQLRKQVDNTEKKLERKQRELIDAQERVIELQKELAEAGRVPYQKPNADGVADKVEEEGDFYTPYGGKSTLQEK